MSSELLGSAQNVLKGNLGGAWDITNGYQDAYTDLGIARRFGGAAAAYSLRDIGAMNGPVVKVRRDVDGDGTDKEENFSANQVSSGALEDWVNGKLEFTLPADVDTAAAAYSLRKVSEGRLIYTGDYSSGTDTISANSTDLTVTGNNDGIFGKDDVLKIENDGQSVPQLQTDTGFYRTSKNGIVEFEYYVPSDHPIVGNYWHIGTASSGGQEIAYTKKGAKIVGGAWTTAKLFYGEKFGGSDKPTGVSDGGQRLITILNKEISDGIVSLVNAEDGDIYYISSLTIKLGIDDVVRIRRSSDNIEVEVGFDSDDKISSSSPISNRTEEGRVNLGDTTSTTLGGFLTTDAAPNFSGNSLLFNGTNTSVGITAITLSGDFTFSFDAFLDFSESNGGRVAGRTSGNGWVVNFETDGSGITTRPDGVSGVAIDFDSTLSSGEHSFVLTRSSGTITLSIDGVTQADTGTKTEDYTINFIGRNASQYFKGSLRNININGVASYNGYGNTDADWIDQIGSNNGTVNGTAEKFLGVSAFVHTWYDQSGVNDAVQTTAANQPQIASSGALLTDGIEFDGTNDRLVSSDGVSVTTTTDISFNLVGESDDITTTQTILSQKSGTGQGRSWTDIISSNFRSSIGGSAKTFGSVGSNGTQFLFTYILDESANTADAFKNSAQSGSQQTVNNAEAADGEIVIGCNNGESGQFLNGHLKEVIIYTSDQTDNRFKIESNINNYYGLYTFQGDGFVETWYDQSGNGEDMTQGTAPNQPSIVINGGQVKDYNGNNSIDFVSGSTRVLDKSGTTTAKTCIVVLDEDSSGSSERAILGFSASTSFMRLDTGNDLEVKAGGVQANYRAVPTDVTALYFWYTNGTDEDKLFANNVEEGDTTSDTPPNLPFTRIGARNSDADPYNSRITEVIAFAEDLSADRTAIQDDVNNHYNIF